MWSSKIGSVYAPSEGEGKLQLKTSTLVADRFIESSKEYKRMMLWHHPFAVAIYTIFVIISPLVFRYCMASLYVTRADFIEAYVPANATISVDIPWPKCENCVDTKGITFKNFTVTVKNITGAYPNDYSEGFPTVAVFASHDFKNWYNFYSPDHANMPAVHGFGTTNIFVNQSLGEACLGEVAATYLVICLNDHYLANNLKKGDYVAPQPFNDRCTQVYGTCGVPCADLTGVKYPPYCPNGVIINDLLYNPNATATKHYTTTETVTWFNGITIVDWIVIIAIILDAFGNILRYLPVSNPPLITLPMLLILS
jgi:hypothetical protein